MKHTYEKKTPQTIASVKPTTLNLQPRGFAPPQSELAEDVSSQTNQTSSENLLEKLISTSTSESFTTPIQRKPQNRLKAIASQRMEIQAKQNDESSAESNLASIHGKPQNRLKAIASQGMAIQAKLNIGEPNDKYEKEADDTAYKVVQQINSPTQDKSIQKQESMEEEDEELQMKPISNIQREESTEEDDELQMKSLVQRRENIGGGEASTDLESSIQSARGSGQPLDKGLQAKMGQAMGADFSGVKVHTDSQSDQLNKSIQAKAFTTGQDVFFRQGAYEPSSRGGQELIAHELTHVVQQGGSKIQRKVNSPLISSACQSLQAAPNFLQMKQLVVNDVASTHQFVGEKDKKIDKNKYKKGSVADVSDTDTYHRKNTTGEIEWYRLNPLADEKYIRASKVYGDVNIDLSKAVTPEDGDDLLGSFKDKAIDTTSTGLERYSKQIEKQEGSTTGVDTAGGSVGIVGGILGMALSIKELAGSPKQWDDWVAGIWNLLVSSGSLTSGITKIISSATDSESDVSKQAKSGSDWSGGFSGAMDTLSGAVKTIKSVIEIIKMWSSDQKYGKDEYLKVGSDIVGGALTTAKGVVESVKSFVEIFNGPLAATIGQAIPPISIAISATKMIVDSYYLASSAYSWTKMRNESQLLIERLENTPEKKGSVTSAKKEYQSKRAEISNLDARKLQKEVKNQDRQTQIAELTKEKTDLEKEKSDLEGNLTKPKITEKQKKEIQSKLTGGMFSSGIEGQIKKIDGKISKLTNLKSATAKKITDASQDIVAREGAMTTYAKDNKISQDDIAEVELAEELKTGNRKRIVRQSIHLSTEAVKIAGNIATLTGVGAVGGVATSASAAGIELALPFFRSLKEYGRNKAAVSQAKGETGTLSQKIFNANKSDKAKLDARKLHTSTIFKMVNRLNDVKESELPASVSRVETFIKAAGCEPKALYRLNGIPNEQASLILKSLYKREF